MMIEAAVKNSEQAFIDYKLFDAFRRDYVKPYIGSVLALIAGVAFMIMQQYIYAVIAAIFTVSFPLILRWLTVKGAKHMLKQNPDYTEMMAFYVFDTSRMHVSFSESGKRSSFNYVDLFCVYETSEVFYIYIQPTKCFILPKSKLTAGSPQQLSRLFSAVLLPRRKFIKR